MNKFKAYLPRLAFTSFILGLMLPSVREVAHVIWFIDFGLGSLNYEFSITIAAFMFAAAIWVGYGLIAQLASSLGYKDSKTTGFVITGDGNIVHMEQKENKNAKRGSFAENVELQTYETGLPLRALQQSRARILDHISGLRNSSIFNLFIGIAIAAIGIATIGTIFFEIESYAKPEKGFEATNFILLVVLPRLSIALIVQVFSFFFLLMYRSNVNDVRYFQNEITNIDLIAAGVSLIKIDSDPNIKPTIGALLKSERNKLMKKNQKVINSSSDEDIILKLASIDNKLSILEKKSQQK